MSNFDKDGEIMKILTEVQADLRQLVAKMNQIAQADKSGQDIFRIVTALCLFDGITSLAMALVKQAHTLAKAAQENAFPAEVIDAAADTLIETVPPHLRSMIASAHHLLNDSGGPTLDMSDFRFEL